METCSISQLPVQLIKAQISVSALQHEKRDITLLLFCILCIFSHTDNAIYAKPGMLTNQLQFKATSWMRGLCQHSHTWHLSPLTLQALGLVLFTQHCPELEKAEGRVCTGDERQMRELKGANTQRTGRQKHARPSPWANSALPARHFCPRGRGGHRSSNQTSGGQAGQAAQALTYGK